MTYADILLSIFIMALFCHGMNTMMGEGMMFHSWRKFYEDFNDEKEAIETLTTELAAAMDSMDRIMTAQKYGFEWVHPKNASGKFVQVEESILNFDGRRAVTFMENELAEMKDYYTGFFHFLLKPIIGCVICFASFWGTIAFVVLNLIAMPHPVTLGLVSAWVLCCVCTSFINALGAKL